MILPVHMPEAPLERVCSPSARSDWTNSRVFGAFTFPRHTRAAWRINEGEEGPPMESM